MRGRDAPRAGRAEAARDGLPAEPLDIELIARSFAFGGGIGFMMAITIMAGIREHLRFSDVPQCLQGPGVTLLVAGILALAFMGFTGVGK